MCSAIVPKMWNHHWREGDGGRARTSETGGGGAPGILAIPLKAVVWFRHAGHLIKGIWVMEDPHVMLLSAKPRTEAGFSLWIKGRAAGVVVWAPNPRFSQILLRQTTCFYICHGTDICMEFTNGATYIWKLHGHPVSYFCPVLNTRKLRGIQQYTKVTQL